MKKLLFMLLLALVGSSAKADLWVGEMPVAGKKYYLRANLGDGVDRFLNNTTNSFDSEPTVLWTVGGTFFSEYTLSSDGGNFAIRKPFASTYVETNSSRTGDDIKLTSSKDANGLWEIHRSKTFIAGGNRNIAVSASGLSTASSATNCWEFISEEQAKQAKAYLKTGSWTNQSIYTIVNNDEYVFWGRGANWGTQAIPTGYDIEARKQLDVTVSNYVARFRFRDTNQYLFDAGGYNIYTDKAEGNDNSTAFYMLPQNGGYKFVLLVDPYLSIGLGKDGDFDVLRLVPTNEAPVWNFCDASASMAINATAKYGTFVAPFEVEIPEGVTASTADVAGDFVVLTALEEGVIPANTPVIVNAESGLGKTTFYGVTEAGTAEEGCLVGNVGTEPVSVPQGAYLLQMQNDVVAFYIVSDDSKMIGANRAYMKEQSDPVKAFKFDGETGIQATTLDELFSGKQTIYDMSGRRVSKAQNGIYIINGKKVLR